MVLVASLTLIGTSLVPHQSSSISWCFLRRPPVAPLGPPFGGMGGPGPGPGGPGPGDMPPGPGPDEAPAPVKPAWRTVQQQRPPRRRRTGRSEQQAAPALQVVEPEPERQPSWATWQREHFV